MFCLVQVLGVRCLFAGMPSGVDYSELGGSLPAIASLNASYSQASLSLPSPYYHPLPPGERKAFSDVRRTFCLFVTFDLLFISMLWIIELNVRFSLWLLDDDDDDDGLILHCKAHFFYV